MVVLLLSRSGPPAEANASAERLSIVDPGYTGLGPLFGLQDEERTWFALGGAV